MNKTEIALFELQIDAFLAGLSELVPDPECYGIDEETASQIIAEHTYEALCA